MAVADEMRSPCNLETHAITNIIIGKHGGKEHKKNTTLSSKKNTLEKTLNHKKETTLKTSREKATPNNKKVNSTTPQASTVMRIRIPHKINLHLTAK